jgi:hypothetical protein
MSAKTYNLKPCPFCGGRAVLHSRYVACIDTEECGAMKCTPRAHTKEETVAAWNRRTPDELKEDL